MLMRTFDDLFRRLEPDLDDLFGGLGPSSERNGRLRPRMEVLGTDSEYVVRVELPGVDPESVDVTLENSILRIRAERRMATAEQGEYLRREFAYGTFEASVVMPAGIDPEKLSARYEGGILEVRVPRSAASRVRVPVEGVSGETKALAAAS